VGDSIAYSLIDGMRYIVAKSILRGLGSAVIWFERLRLDC